jgi:hypothetical protein
MPKVNDRDIGLTYRDIGLTYRDIGLAYICLRLMIET